MTEEKPGGKAGFGRNPMLVATIVACAFFMETLDSTVIVTALPKMAETFGTGAVDLSIGLTVYMLCLAIFIPASGWIADRYGSRTVFSAAILLFTGASILCGLSDGMWEFVVARILQGIGGSLMSPVGRLNVLRATDKKNLVRAMNFLTFPGLIGPVVGPPLGGFIATYASWRWIFFINVPIGIVGVLLVWRFLDNHFGERRRFDLVGFLLNGLSLSAVLYGLQMIATPSDDWRIGAGLAVAGLIVAIVAWRRALGHPHPLIDLSAHKIRTYAVVNSAGSIFRISIAAPIFLLPLFLQVGLGMSAFTAGLMVLAHTAGDFSIKAVTTRTLRWLGFRTVLIWTCALFVVSMASSALFSPTTSLAVIVVVLYLTGAFRSLQLTALTSLQFAEIPPALISSASTFAAVVQQVTRGFGIAVAAILLNLSSLFRGSGEPDLGDYRIVMVAIAAIGFLSLLWYVGLPRDMASEVSGHTPRERA